MFEHESTAELVEQLVGSVAGFIPFSDDQSNFAIVKGVVANVSLDMPYSQSLSFGTVGGASNARLQLD